MKCQVLPILLSVVAAISTVRAEDTDQPRKPGSQWALDIDKVLKAKNEDMAFEVDAAASSGKMAFQGVETVDGIISCRTRMDIALKAKSLKAAPPETKITRADWFVSVEDLLPLDPAIPGYQGSMKMKFDCELSIPWSNGKSAVVTIKSAREKNGRSRPVK